MALATTAIWEVLLSTKDLFTSLVSGLPQQFLKQPVTVACERYFSF